MTFLFLKSKFNLFLLLGGRDRGSGGGRDLDRRDSFG